MAAIDLTELNQLTALINALLQAFLPIILIGVFVSFLVMLVGGGAILLKIVIFNFAPQPSQVSFKKRGRTVIKLSITVFLTILVLSMASSPATGSMAAVETVTVGSTQVFANTPLTITAASLNASETYALVYDGDLADATAGTVLFNWTTAAVPVDMVITVETLPSSAGNDVIILLQGENATASSMNVTAASLTIFIAVPESFLPTTFIITLGIAIIIIGVITLVVKSIVQQA